MWRVCVCVCLCFCICGRPVQRAAQEYCGRRIGSCRPSWGAVPVECVLDLDLVLSYGTHQRRTLLRRPEVDRQAGGCSVGVKLGLGKPPSMTRPEGSTSSLRRPSTLSSPESSFSPTIFADASSPCQHASAPLQLATLHPPYCPSAPPIILREWATRHDFHLLQLCEGSAM